MTEKEESGRKKLINALKEYELSFEEKYPPEDIEIEFSEQYNKYMENLLAGKIPAPKKRKNRFCKRIAACAAVVLLLFGGSMTVKAFREPVTEFFTNVYEKIIEIFFQDDDITKSPSEIETVYTLGYVPEGYELESFEVDNFKTTAKTVFVNNDNKIAFFQSILNGTSSMDNENTEYQYQYINDIKIAVIEKNSKKTLFWNTNEYAFKLIVDIGISEEDLAIIISSITEKD